MSQRKGGILDIQTKFGGADPDLGSSKWEVMRGAPGSYAQQTI